MRIINIKCIPIKKSNTEDPYEWNDVRKYLKRIENDTPGKNEIWSRKITNYNSTKFIVDTENNNKSYLLWHIGSEK